MHRNVGLHLTFLNRISGWGHLTVNLALQLKKRGIPLIFTEKKETLLSCLDMHRHQFGDEDYSALHDLVVKKNGAEVDTCFYPANHQLALCYEHGPAQSAAKRNISLTNFESSRFAPKDIDAGQRYDLHIVPSHWNRDLLIENKMEAITLHQAVDPLFHSLRKLRDAKVSPPRMFTVFSGGKLEFRKGQDIAIAAFKVLRSRHQDCQLITSWNFFSDETVRGLELNGYVSNLPNCGLDPVLSLDKWLFESGLPAGSFINTPPSGNGEIALQMLNADVGLFPNRCEGGTNLVAMESLATGMPIIISANTGHRDLISAESGCFSLSRQNKVKNPEIPQITSVDEWGESDLEETIEALEHSYKAWKSGSIELHEPGTLTGRTWEVYGDEIVANLN